MFLNKLLSPERIPSTLPNPLPLLDFGGQGAPLHFAHSNGFPPATFGELFAAMQEFVHISALELRPLWQGSDPHGVEWWNLAADLGTYLSQLPHPLIASGHSLGSVLTLRLAAAYPQWFSALVLFDPVLLPSGVMRQWLLAILTRQRKRHPLYRAAARRQQVFDSRENMFARYRAARPFANWSDTAIHNYVNAATQPLPNGKIGLRYPVAWETHIYTSTPLDLWAMMKRVRVPLTIIYGEKSDAFFGDSIARVQKLLPQAELHCIAGAGHLVPMERPQECASLARDFLQRQGLLGA